MARYLLDVPNDSAEANPMETNNPLIYNIYWPVDSTARQPGWHRAPNPMEIGLDTPSLTTPCEPPRSEPLPFRPNGENQVAPLLITETV